ncbi:hypothetical protein SSYRP_v1c04780 [Spiroplasma syrphidicola EA-1]|uniref:Uncharacterized protein n=1 Tax=Spiroplasma syrphidicola EA-1 TaxID=1276229 RepID=R4UIT7_9MOLU|nr:hypothetical protein [Spiroplasma syrphidicola]AGM26070.1 hypothetical protein SSYRP_v1c04780 [Spiroplasma syrphidicola EA-1]
MGIKSLLGGETNYKAIDKHYQKEYKKLAEKQKFNNEMDKDYLEWIELVGPENFINKLFEISKDQKTTETLIKEFLERHPDAIPPEYNPYYVKPEIKQENSSDLEALKIEKEILEMKLKLKELENSKEK